MILSNIAVLPWRMLSCARVRLALANASFEGPRFHDAHVGLVDRRNGGEALLPRRRGGLHLKVDNSDATLDIDVACP